MRKILPIIVIVICVVLVGCGFREGTRTNDEMFAAAYDIYQDCIIELGIDSTLFMPPICRAGQDSLMSYKWVALSPKGDTLGIEVQVAKSKAIEPEMILTESNDALDYFVGSKDKNIKEPGENP